MQLTTHQQKRKDKSRAATSPVIVVEDEEGVVGLLVAAGGVRDGNAPAAAVHAPHPELHRDGSAGPVLEVVQDDRLQHIKSAQRLDMSLSRQRNMCPTLTLHEPRQTIRHFCTPSLSKMLLRCTDGITNCLETPRSAETCLSDSARSFKEQIRCDIDICDASAEAVAYPTVWGR